MIACKLCYLNVTDPPYFWNTKEVQYVVIGSDALIKCEAKGDINPLISWHKDNFEPIEVRKSLIIFFFSSKGASGLFTEHWQN